MKSKFNHSYISAKNVTIFAFINVFLTYITITSYDGSDLFYWPRITTDHSLEIPSIFLVLATYLAVNCIFFFGIVKRQNELKATQKKAENE